MRSWIESFFRSLTVEACLMIPFVASFIPGTVNWTLVCFLTRSSVKLWLVREELWRSNGGEAWSRLSTAKISNVWWCHYISSLYLKFPSTTNIREDMCSVHTCHHVVQQKENATLCILTEISLDNTFTIPNETLMNYTSRSVLYPLPSET